MNVAQITIGGRLGKDPEYGTTTSGKDCTRFSLAVNTGFGERQITTWYNVSIYGKSAKPAAEYLKKGGLAVVWGEVSNRAYTDKSGNERTSLDVSASGWSFAGGKNESAPSQPASGGARAAVVDDGFGDSDIPF
jgi:single-strand DNA-binding protein